jgi:hypothetical protein
MNPRIGCCESRFEPGVNGGRVDHRIGSERDRPGRHEFERREQLAGRAADEHEQVGESSAFRQRQLFGRTSRRQGSETQHRATNGAERCFACHEQLFDVTADVVPKLPHLRDDSAVRENGLDAEDEVACRSIADQRQSTGIGAYVAAKTAASFRAETKWQQQTGTGSGVLRKSDRRCGLGDRNTATLLFTPLKLTQ